MGIVQKQTIRGTAWSYLGALLGFVNIILLSPKIFTTGEIGVVQLLTLVCHHAGTVLQPRIHKRNQQAFPLFQGGQGQASRIPGLSLL
jgi:hypothetical protein